MKHRFNLFYDLIYPLAAKIVGKRYGCCRKLKNCTRCCKKNGWDDWEKEETVMYDDLVKRLRARAKRENDYYEHGGDIINEAADAIEELSKRLNCVTTERNAAMTGLGNVPFGAAEGGLNNAF